MVHLGARNCNADTDTDREFNSIFIQENSRRLWRSRRRKSSSVPEGGADFPAAIFLAGKCPNLDRDSISRCRKIRELFSSSVEICRKTFQQRISDSHSLHSSFLIYARFHANLFPAGLNGGVDRKGGYSHNCLPVQCFSAPPDRQPYCDIPPCRERKTT